MGYTHYWDCPQTKTLPLALQEACKRIIKTARSKYFIQVQWEDDTPRAPEITGDVIRFNGVGEDGHETFYFENHAGGFCKTARKDYDAVVVACLIAAKQYITGFEWRSDGDPEEHADGVRLYNEANGASLATSNVTPREQ